MNIILIAKVLKTSAFLFLLISCGPQLEIPTPLPNFLLRHYGEEIRITTEAYLEEFRYLNHVEYNFELDKNKAKSNLIKISNPVTYKVIDIESYMFIWGGDSCNLTLKEATSKYPKIRMKCSYFRFFRDYFEQMTKAKDLLSKQSSIYIYYFSYYSRKSADVDKLVLNQENYDFLRERKVNSFDDIYLNDGSISAMRRNGVFVSGKQLAPRKKL